MTKQNGQPEKTIEKWNLVIDVERCENCNNCFLADKDEYCGNSFPGYTEEQPRHGHRWINIHRRERGSGSLMDVAYLPTMCNQCQDAPCVKASPNGEIYQREDGIVMIDPIKAKGQKRLVKTCPYEHIWWNEELELPQKWFFDAHLLDQGWREPRCVQSCGTGAIKSYKISDENMMLKVEQEGLSVLHPEHHTKPRIWYKNLHRFNRDFIAGSVVSQVGDVVDCVASAQVTLYCSEQEVSNMQTNHFGDFKFDGLQPSDNYRLVIKVADNIHEIAIKLSQSVYVGPIHIRA